MDLEERDYFLHRAETELDLAQRATHPGAVQAHYQFADLYLDRVYGKPVEAEHVCTF